MPPQQTKTVHKVTNVIFLVAFLLAAGVQFNDPDPMAWVAIYGVAAGFCVLEILGRAPLVGTAVVAVTALLWSLSLVPFVLGHPPVWAEVFSDTRMMSAGVEETREALGLLLVALWMGYLAWTNYKRAKA